MDPISLFLLFGSSLFSLVGDYREKERNKRQAERNQQEAWAAAGEAINRGTQEAGRVRMAGSKLAAQQRVAYAASGVDPTVGTAAAVQAETAALADMDARTVENNAAREAWGLKSYGLKFREQANLEEERFRNRAAGTILTTAGNLASMHRPGSSGLSSIGAARQGPPGKLNTWYSDL